MGELIREPAEEVSWDLAREIAAKSFVQLPTENIPLIDAVGRVLAAEAKSLCALPAYETSAMDGWVLAGPGPWKIVGEIFTGKADLNPLITGHCMKIATGGVIPSGGQSVLRWEAAEEIDGYIKGETSLGEDIRPAGAESKTGDVLITSGVLLTPTMVGLLAAAGYDHVTVTKKVRAALFLLGDELIHHGIPANGQIRDSLGIQIPALLNQIGVEVIAINFMKDELSHLIEKFKEIIESVDIIVTTGGTADGPQDHVHKIVAALDGKFLVDRIKARPGHPMLLAEIPSVSKKLALLGLPGNPQSAVVALLTLGTPLIYSLLGRNSIPLEEFPTAQELVAAKGFTRLIAGNLIAHRFHAANYLGSAMLRGLAHSTGFAVIPSGTRAEGEMIRWLPLPTCKFW